MRPSLRAAFCSRRGVRFWAVLLGVFLVVAGTLWWWRVWDAKSALPARGGLYFLRQKLLRVPAFAQADPRWGGEKLGPTPATLGAEGCALTCAAMALASYGVDVDPPRLNRFLSENGGYTQRGWIYWEVAALYREGTVRHAYEDLPSYRLMDWNLLLGNPVIVRVRPPGRGTHFVLVVGKRGFDYLAQDPGSGGRLVNLSSFESRIEALRFYERL